MPYREGDHYVISDRTGRKVLASRTVKEWSGGIVERNHAIDLQRHPQEIQRIVAEQQTVPNPRPRPPDIFIGPVETNTAQTAAAGTIYLVVASIRRIVIGDVLGVMLGNLDLWLTSVRQVYPDLTAEAAAALSQVAFSEAPAEGTLFTVIELESALPWAVDLGALIIDYSASTFPDVRGPVPPIVFDPVLGRSFDDSFDDSFG